ncbi:hypothetical protein [Leptospira sp. GIMC2001]|uniref:hypothetical protein n=1 Tax=Leptospira sp. GIMC2001 TaxID=1513297 RepID=UPI002349CCF4|nr:hypothetical protein [Leptospira sp. GIMC2001]WCL51011.1 hypothetical protein O4O04_09425 [Leptospira sp. GIMC2001]
MLGWVFEPFLTKIYSFNQNDNAGQYSCRNKDIFLNKFKRIKKRKHFKPDDNKSETDKYDDYFDENIVSKTIIYYGGGYTTTEFPGKNIKEVFEFYKQCDQKLNFVDFEISNNKFVVDFYDENNSSETYKFEFKDNKTIVFSGGQV